MCATDDSHCHTMCVLQIVMIRAYQHTCTVICTAAAAYLGQSLCESHLEGKAQLLLRGILLPPGNGPGLVERCHNVAHQGLGGMQACPGLAPAVHNTEGLKGDCRICRKVED